MEILTITTDIRKARRRHKEHLSGSGQHDNRPKRLRTRNAQKQFTRKEWE